MIEFYPWILGGLLVVLILILGISIWLSKNQHRPR